jgi:ribosome maturation factor RimP
MITQEQIESLVSQKIEGTGIFIVEVQIRPGNSILIHLDKPEGISIDECVGISRYINANLDREIEDYDLEVSSPGLGHSFKVKEQYLKNIGRGVELILKDGKKLNGKLLGYTGQSIELEILVKDTANGKNKKPVPEKIRY